MKLKYDLYYGRLWKDLEIGECFEWQDTLYVKDETGGRELLYPANHEEFEPGISVQRLQWRVK